ncbi:MAG: hypothetical protein JWO33_1313 [Caulobacteraceae bacterium]|nr:hypothetical protein [Caulobacteraceae bacterium]
MPKFDDPQRPSGEPRSFQDKGGTAPNARPRERGSRQDDPAADSILPGREFGAGGQVDDGPPRTERPDTGV